VGVEAQKAVHLHVLGQHPGAVFAEHHACDGEVPFRCRRRAGCTKQNTCDQVEEGRVGSVRAPKRKPVVAGGVCREEGVQLASDGIQRRVSVGNVALIRVPDNKGGTAHLALLLQQTFA